MEEILVIGAGPAGLLAAWLARQRGARVQVMARGIGTTHIIPGWIGVLDDENGMQTSADECGQTLALRLGAWNAAHPGHPYALAGLDALAGGLAAFHEVCRAAGLNYVGGNPKGIGDPSGLHATNFRLPTALGAVKQAALVPESFAAGDLRQDGEMLIAAPAGWRDFYPKLCADNLARQGFPARSVAFELPEMRAASHFDATPVGLAHLFDQATVRERVAAQIVPRLDSAARVGFPAVLGYEHHNDSWRDLQDRLGVPVFEIPTLPPSVPGMRLFDAFRMALRDAGVPIFLDMTAERGVIADREVTSVVVPTVSRDAVYRPEKVILATGGLYGGGIDSDHRGQMREVVFDLPVRVPGGLGDWFNERFISNAGHPVHRAGVRANGLLQPLDERGQVLATNLYVAGRLLAGYDPIVEGSNEGVLLATAYRAAVR